MKKILPSSEFLLTKKQIDLALPKIAKGLDQYIWLQENIHKCNVSKDKEFQRKFNGYYKMIYPSQDWKKCFYNLMELRKKHATPPTFSLALFTLYSKSRLREKDKNKKTKKLYASFVSKLVATLNPKSPIIDSVVLKSLGLKLPSSKEIDRLKKTDVVYDSIVKIYKSFLVSDNGKYLVAQFKKVYPGKNISDIKMLDFVIWQTRD